VALVARALGDRLTLVTDAVAALGTPEAGDDGVRLPDGTLAGSTLALDQAVRNLARYAGLPLASALAAATSAPARVLGLADRGTIAPGAVADLVLLDEAGGLVATVVGGRVAHDRRETGAPWRS
jgi:N-acetylglucosamine-6-phosphate deacetylase